MNQRSMIRTAVPMALAVLLAGCASGGETYNPPVRSYDGVRVVSCQLPPQIRRLGQQATYLAAGRIIESTAADCRVRGGQYRDMAAAPVAAAGGGGPMAVIVGGDAATPACPVSGTVARLREGSTLNVRAGPGTDHERLDALRNGRRIFVCDGTPDEGWLGIVYPTDGGADCGVDRPIPGAAAYRGPCRAGWVNAGWVQTER